jgi:hypothetical protein
MSNSNAEEAAEGLEQVVVDTSCTPEKLATNAIESPLSEKTLSDSQDDIKSPTMPNSDANSGIVVEDQDSVYHPNIEAAKNGETNGSGRPSKCTPETLMQLLMEIQSGLTVTKACQVVGISRETFYTWKENYKDFSDACEKAELEFEKSLIQGGLNKTYDSNFARFLLQCKPKTREDYKPPLQEQKIDATHKFDKSEKLKELADNLKQEGFNGA